MLESASESRNRSGPIVPGLGLAALVLLSLLVNQPAVRAEWSGIEWLRGLLLAAWIGLVVWTAWRVIRPTEWWVRTLTGSVLMLLLIGIIAPPDLLQIIKDWLAVLVSLLSLESGPGVGLNVHALGHFGLFAVLAILLFLARADLGAWRLLGLLAGLAVATELMQLFVDGRYADWRDVLIDLAGVGLGVLLVGTARLGVQRFAADRMEG